MRRVLLPLVLLFLLAPCAEADSATRKALAALRAARTLAQRLEAYVKDHAYDASLRIDDLCTHFNISPRYVSKLFREHLSTSFKKCVAEHRVLRAKQLIESGDEPLYSVADKCGFRNYRQLTSTFKKVEGMLPRTYREVCDKT